MGRGQGFPDILIIGQEFMLGQMYLPSDTKLSKIVPRELLWVIFESFYNLKLSGIDRIIRGLARELYNFAQRIFRGLARELYNFCSYNYFRQCFVNSNFVSECMLRSPCVLKGTGAWRKLFGCRQDAFAGRWFFCPGIQPNKVHLHDFSCLLETEQQQVLTFFAQILKGNSFFSCGAIPSRPLSKNPAPAGSLSSPKKSRSEVQMMR